jgi:hypothetical protein
MKQSRFRYKIMVDSSLEGVQTKMRQFSAPSFQAQELDFEMSQTTVASKLKASWSLLGDDDLF